MILLWGLAEDTPLGTVHDALRSRGAPYAFLDQRRLLETVVECSVGQCMTASVQVGEEVVDLAAVSAIYARPHDWRHLPDVAVSGESSPAWNHALAVDDLLHGWLEIAPALVLNRPSAMASNNCKPLQALHIQRYGFQIPDTLITTDADAARAFWARHGSVVYKSVSGVRSIVSRLTHQHEERMKDLAWCPTQLQEYIPGEDYRVHVVGEALFACRIVSEADDYRYAGRQDRTVIIEACDIPDECAHRCLALAESLELPLAGVDLRRTPDGRWFCFEVNPSPAFCYYQHATGQPIAAAVARLLMEASPGARRVGWAESVG